ncbi:hypothetical protein P4O66_020068, partial [Electrophorus voltai]
GLFLCFWGLADCRLHFGMNGSIRINPAERHDPGEKPPALSIRLTKHAICFFDSTVEMRLSEDCEEKVQIMAGLDMCSPVFSQSRAVEAVCRDSRRMLCDVLLDQAVLPGVGNIIKNEALLNSSLHPAVKVNQLRAEHVQHLVKMARDFSLLFYQCKKRGCPLYCHCKVYKRSVCGQCDGAVTVCRLGDHSRMTYFCQHCQTLDPGEVDISKLQGQSAMLGWAHQRDVGGHGHIATKEEEEWTCDLCTLINRPISRSCEACLTPRPESPGGSRGVLPFPSALIRYPSNSFSCPKQELRLHCRAAFGNTTLVLTDLSCERGPTEAPSPASNRPRSPLVAGGGASMQPGMQPTTSQLARRASPVSPSQPSKRRKTEPGDFRVGIVPNSIQHSSRCDEIHVEHYSKMLCECLPVCCGNGIQGHTTVPTTPCCTAHGRPSLLRVVAKAGENQGRHFYTCSLPRGTQCNFFKWADLHFPKCHHGKHTLMRTVLKLGPNNGRNFYVCPLKRGKQCDFFQWAGNGPNNNPPLQSPTNQLLA